MQEEKEKLALIPRKELKRWFVKLIQRFERNQELIEELESLVNIYMEKDSQRCLYTRVKENGIQVKRGGKWKFNI